MEYQVIFFLLVSNLLSAKAERIFGYFFSNNNKKTVADMESCLSVQYNTTVIYGDIKGRCNGNFCGTIGLNTEKVRWETAVTRCEQKQEVLLVSSEADLQKIRYCFPIHDDVWVGRFQFRSPWLEVYGCYGWGRNALLPNSHQISGNHPALCDNACGHPVYFGLQGDNCFCLNDAIDSALLEKTNVSYCNKQCHSQPELYCGGYGSSGGNNAISVYRNGNFKVQGRGGEECATYNCVRNKHIPELNAKNCTSTAKIICENGTVPSQSPMYGKWSLKMQHCINMFHGYTFLSDSKFSICKVSRYVRKYWSGIFRSVVDGDILQSNRHLVNRRRCYQLKRNTTDIELADCNKQNYYICQNDLKTTTDRFTYSTATKNAKSTIKIKNSTLVKYLPPSSDNSDGNVHQDQSSRPSSNSTTANSKTGISSSGFTNANYFPKLVKTTDKFTDSKTTTNEKSTTNVNNTTFDLVDFSPPLSGHAEGNVHTGNGIVVGVVFAVVITVLPVAIGIHIFIKKRRFSKDLPPSAQFRNIKYAKRANSQPQTSQGNDRAQISSDYELANPTEAGYSCADYVYTDTKEGEYDTLHDQKRKIHNGANNVYAHTYVGNIAENEYDVTHVQIKQEQELSNYDHMDLKSNA